MAQKAAVAIIVDVGYSELLSKEEGQKFLQTSRECASMIIQTKMFQNSKDVVSLILMGCKDCNNHDGESHGNIKLAFPFVTPSWHMVRKLKCDCTDYHRANWIEAINVALQMMQINPGKFAEKKIVVFTSNLKLGSIKNLVLLESSIQNQAVDLTLIHPVVNDDPEMAELKNDIDEAISIVEKVEGTDVNIEEAALQLLSFQRKKVKPRPWNVCLDIGSNILIPVSGYKKMNASQVLTWTNSISKEGQSAVFQERVATLPHEKSLEENLPGHSVKVARENINVRCDGTEVKKSEIIEGFHFGSSIVPFSEENKAELNYKSGEKCLSVVKITKKVFVPRHYWIENSTTCLVARDDDEDAAVAFSAIVQALDHLESVAIVRRLYYSNTKPHMGALFPVIKPNKEYLVFVELPFSDYMRKCLMPGLKVDHLTAKQFEVVDQLIDEMDLSVPVNEGIMMERQWSDLLQPHKIFDPYLQHVRRCVASRILNPGAPLPSMDSDIYKMLVEPPQPIKESVSETLDEISRLFPNLGPEHGQHKKGRGKRDTNSTGAVGGKIDVETGEQSAKQMKADRAEPEKKKNEESEIVGILSPIEDFKTAVESKSIPFIKVCKQMQEVIIKLVLSSFGLIDFEKPQDCLRTLRDAVITYKMDKSDSVTSYNSWMKDLYQLLQEKFKMGFWSLIKQENLGFISSEECSESSLSVTEINEILGSCTSPGQTMSDEEEMDLPIDM